MPFADLDLTTTIVNFGLPTVILAVLLLALWRIGNWLILNVVTPIVTSIVSLIRTMEARIPEQCRKLDGIARLEESMARQEAALERQTAIQKQLLAATNAQTDKQVTAINRLGEKQEQTATKRDPC